MDYLKEYKSFINSHYLSQGVRITIGVILPAIVLSYFNLLSIGIVVSLGAMSVSLTDSPGPIHHRRNGMIACNLVVFVIALLTGFSSRFPFLLGLVIFLSCFSFSMIGVYGSRATAIGLSALLVLVLNIDRPLFGIAIFLNALYILAGGAWYLLLSLVLYSFRPYKLSQQALGEGLQSTADYLRIKASFYHNTPDYDKSYQRLLEQQIDLHQKQDLIRELLFKSRSLVKDSTNTSRILVMIFLDIVDLFESIMTSHQDYKALHLFFDNYDILQQYQQVMYTMANELDEIGIAVKSGKVSSESPRLVLQIQELRKKFLAFRDQYRTAENVEGFISLRQILDSIGDIADRLHTLHSYTGYDKTISNKFEAEVDYDQFVSHQDIEPQLLKENLSLHSNIFRHSLRVSIATLLGYIISKFLPFGHSYWVLLTIIVILKPAYSLTKKRNYERLFGTIAGALIGILVLHFFKDKTLLLAFMIFFMICTYSLLRIRYLLSVLFMTPYILLLFHLLNPSGFDTILSDRLIDTGIGSGIAFLANIFILPAWEHEQIFEYVQQMLVANTQYFTDTTAFFKGIAISVNQYKLSRKNTYVSLANLSDAFSRMLSEPKRKQKNIRDIHQFVVLNHMLTSHVATLAYYTRIFHESPQEDYLTFINSGETRLDNARLLLQKKQPIQEAPEIKEKLRMLNEKVSVMTENRKIELKKGITDSDLRKQLSRLKPVADQFNFILKIGTELEKLSVNLRENISKS